jgi:hypothetical protein
MAGQRQRKKLLAAAAVVLAGAAAPAVADIGLGAAITNGAFDTGTTILLPIRTPTLMIEPQLAYVDQKQGGNTTKGTSLGVGVYLRKEVGPLFEAYYGGILSYDQLKTTPGGGAETKSTAFSIIPTVGVAHYFSKQFSIALDVGLQYQDGTTKAPGGDQDIKTIATVARILVRGFVW